MILDFIKMHGAGNDYIYIDCTDRAEYDFESLAIKLSDRHKGIGGDGLVALCRSESSDVKMRMFNADGSEGKMCGNAIRCVAKLAYERLNIKKSELSVETLSGVKIIYPKVEGERVVAATVDMGAPKFAPKDIPALVPDDGSVLRETLSGVKIIYPKVEGERVVAATVDMGAPKFAPKDIPALVPDDGSVLRTLSVDGVGYGVVLLSMGNPHCVVFCDEIDNLELERIGPRFENLAIFPERINTEFIKLTSPSSFDMRVWERGSGETLACGTGACAALAACTATGRIESGTEVTAKLLGGELILKYTATGISMTGNCVEVFTGKVEI